MKTTNDGQRPFVEKASSDMREYVQSLLDENQRLSKLAAELQLALSQRESIEAMLKQQVAAIEEESRRYSERYLEVEQQNTNLANLYVASYQLNGTLDRERVLQAVKEIIINLIGCEELAIWELNEELGALVLAGSFGIDHGRWASVGLGSGLVGKAAQSGERFIAEPGSTELTACIPLKLDERVIGVIGIFTLLQQKQGLEPVDFELFDLLASHAATSLYCTRLAGAAVAAE
jgi:regulator of replication initiation timing